MVSFAKIVPGISISALRGLVETIKASAVITCCCPCAPAGGVAPFFLSLHDIIAGLMINKLIPKSSLYLFTLCSCDLNLKIRLISFLLTKFDASGL